jgi:hypothetical protein
MLYGQGLIDTAAALFRSARKRIWIATPYIGGWISVQRIMGTKWIGDLRIEIRILADISDTTALDRETIKAFQKRAEIRSLEGLHAKSYIIDNTILITSANLTGTAFQSRWEIGYLTSASEENIAFYKKWWKDSSFVGSDWLPKKRNYKNSHGEDSNKKFLHYKWRLPDLTGNGKLFKPYLEQIKIYNHFRRVYEQSGSGRILPEIPIFQEIDDFLNYLFHEHPRVPSHEYIKKSYRRMTDEERRSIVARYKLQYRRWKKTDAGDDRKDRIKAIRTILSQRRISKLSKKDAAIVAHYINAISSYPLNLTRFLRNNSIQSIRAAWSVLLHDVSQPLEVRMQSCKEKLSSFGKSSIQELLAHYYPTQYPVINRNPNAGLKFLGYDIRVY